MASTLDRALSSLLKSLEAVLPAKDALIAFRKAVDHAVANVAGSAEGSKPERASKAKPSKGGKSGKPRGPKKGGRQLKAHVGKKAFDALDDEVKDKARTVIRNAGEKWNAMTMDDRSKLLSPILKGVKVE